MLSNTLSNKNELEAVSEEEIDIVSGGIFGVDDAALVGIVLAGMALGVALHEVK